MNIELWLQDRKDPGKKRKLDLDLPTVPRRGDCIVVGDYENYEVQHVIYRIDADYRFAAPVEVNAISLWNAH